MRLRRSLCESSRRLHTYLRSVSPSAAYGDEPETQEMMCGINAIMPFTYCAHAVGQLAAMKPEGEANRTNHATGVRMIALLLGMVYALDALDAQTPSFPHA